MNASEPYSLKFLLLCLHSFSLPLQMFNVGGGGELFYVHVGVMVDIISHLCCRQPLSFPLVFPDSEVAEWKSGNGKLGKANKLLHVRPFKGDD